MKDRDRSERQGSEGKTGIGGKDRDRRKRQGGSERQGSEEKTGAGGQDRGLEGWAEKRRVETQKRTSTELGLVKEKPDSLTTGIV